MNLKQLLKKTLKEWADISGLDFCLFDSNGKLFLPAESHTAPTADKIEAFLEEEACAKATDSIHYYKIILGNELFYVLVVWGKGTQSHTIGELAVCQIETIHETTREKLDKNTYMQPSSWKLHRDRCTQSCQTSAHQLGCSKSRLYCRNKAVKGRTRTGNHPESVFLPHRQFYPFCE